MRRSLRGLIAISATTSILLAAGPAWADGDDEGGVSVRGGGGGSATVEVGASSGGGGGGKSSGGGGKASGGGGRGGTTSVSSGGRTSVGNYSSGSPSSVSSSRPDNVEILDDGSRATYKPEGAYVQPEGGSGPTAFFDGMTQGQPDPAEPATPDAPAQAQEPAPQVDPAELAQTAVSQMGLEAPEIASTPNDTETLGAVGLPVWLWVANPGETTTGPNTTSASAGAVTVTATAKFTGMSIDMGDGTTIECDGPGTEYPGTGIDPSPDCGHVYEQMSDEQPDGLYTVNITAHWGVEWESNTGETGTIPVELTTSKQLRIGQYQTVVTAVS